MSEHRIPSDISNFVRVIFALSRDDDGYPPADNETMWAATCDHGKYRLDNIPFYASGVSLGDLIAADAVGPGPLRFRSVLEPSMHSTLRVMLSEDCTDDRPLTERMDELRRKLKDIGCDTEANHPGFFAVDVPPTVRIAAVRAILSIGFEAGLWDYEEATLWQP